MGGVEGFKALNTGHPPLGMLRTRCRHITPSPDTYRPDGLLFCFRTRLRASIRRPSCDGGREGSRCRMYTSCVFVFVDRDVTHVTRSISVVARRSIETIVLIKRKITPRTPSFPTGMVSPSRQIILHLSGLHLGCQEFEPHSKSHHFRP